MLTAAALMQACCGAGSRLCRPPYASSLMSLLIDIPLSTAGSAGQRGGERIACPWPHSCRSMPRDDPLFGS
jgi:hypothetical protein